MSAHNEFLAGSIASFVALGVPVGLLLGARRAAAGRLPLGAPTDEDEAARLGRVGQSLRPKATVGLVIVGVVFVVMLLGTALT